MLIQNTLKPHAGCAARAPHGDAGQARKLTIALLLVSATIGSASAGEYRWGGGPAATLPSVGASYQSAVMPRSHVSSSHSREASSSAAQVAGLRAALNLKPSQQQYWAPVEAALTALVRRHEGGSSLAAMAMQLRRLRSVATPLLRTLDSGQKQEAMRFARRMGYGELIASF